MRLFLFYYIHCWLYFLDYTYKWYPIVFVFLWFISHSMIPSKSIHDVANDKIVTFLWLSRAMAPHSSTLAWKIPWMEEPGRLQSMGSLRVGQDWATSLSLSCTGEGNGNPLQCSCLENPRDRGAWWAAVYGVAQSRTRRKRLSSSSSKMNAIVQWFEHSLALPFFGTEMKTDLFQSCSHCWIFQICWHIERSTFTALSFRIWNSSIEFHHLH